MERVVLIAVDERPDGDSAVAEQLRRLRTAINEHGVQVRWTHRRADALAVIRSDATLSAMLVAWDAAYAEEIMTAVTKRFHRLPVFLLTTEHEPRDVPLWVHEVIQGYVFPLEDTPGFIAGRIAHAAEQYAEGMLPPFFEALRHLEDSHRYSWHTPAHAAWCRVPEVAGGPRVLRLLRRTPAAHGPVHLRARAGLAPGAHRPDR